MDTRVVRVLAGGAFALAALGSAVNAQTAPPKPAPASPSPTPLAFTARAHADVTVVSTGRTITGSAVLGMSQRANLTGVDVISVKTDAIPLPPVSATFVVDRSARTVTGWSERDQEILRPAHGTGSQSRADADAETTGDSSPARHFSPAST